MIMNLEELVIPLQVKDLASSGINSVTASLGKLNVGFLAVGAAITATVGAAVGLMATAAKATFEWADELDKLQDVTGVTNKEAAALNFVLRKSGVGTETLTKGMVILEKGLVKVDGTLDLTGQKLKDYGINIFDANGQMKDQASLINDVSKKYTSFSTQQERINFLTDVFGKSGANLVDFFDTLSSEGGIDKVTQKVEQFGLAIDPARYEAFNRNLEELKLMALGVAVQFTEKLMPVLEGFLGWVNSLQGKSPGEIFKAFGDGLIDITDKFKNWAKNIDWNQVSEDIINGINSVDWAGIGNTVRTVFGNIFEGLGAVINKTDWNGIYLAAGRAFLNFMAGLTNQGTWSNVKTTWSNNLNQLKQIANTLMQNIYNTFKGWIDKIIAKIKSIPSTIGLNTTTSTYMPPGRASGGPVIAGQSYSVAEFNKPEVFTPNTNGRIDSSKPIQVTLDEDRLATVMGRVFAQELQKVF